MTPYRYEIVPRPTALGGGWNLRLIGRDLETGQESEMGGGVFPIQDGEDARDAYQDAYGAGLDWLQVDDEAIAVSVERRAS